MLARPELAQIEFLQRTDSDALIADGGVGHTVLEAES
jgi:hypothetical protein